VYVLDTVAWEWLQLVPDGDDAAGVAARVGHTATLVPDARGLLRHAAHPPPALPLTPMPAVVLVGGARADGTRAGDVGILALPPPLWTAMCGTTAPARAVPPALPAAAAGPSAESDAIPLGQSGEAAVELPCTPDVPASPRMPFLPTAPSMVSVAAGSGAVPAMPLPPPSGATPSWLHGGGGSSGSGAPRAASTGFTGSSEDIPLGQAR